MKNIEVNLVERRFISGLLFFTVLSALLPSGFSWIDYDESISAVEGSLGFKVQWGLIIAASFLIVIKNRYYVISQVVYSNTFLFALCIYCGLSIIWSPVESATLKKTIHQK